MKKNKLAIIGGSGLYDVETRKDIVWENFLSDNSDYYLLPIINKKYYKEIGYKK